VQVIAALRTMAERPVLLPAEPPEPDLVIEALSPLSVPAVDRLMQLHLHDLSEHLPPGLVRCDASARFRYGDEVADWLTDPHSACFLARVDGLPVAFVLVRDDTCRSRDGLSIEEIFVLRAWRRQGIGGRLCTWLCQSAPPRHWEFSQLASNTRGLQFARTTLQRATGQAPPERARTEDGRAILVQELDLTAT
jgi:predicted acetyltransferase